MRATTLAALHSDPCWRGLGSKVKPCFCVALLEAVNSSLPGIQARSDLGCFPSVPPSLQPSLCCTPLVSGSHLAGTLTPLLSCKQPLSLGTGSIPIISPACSCVHAKSLQSCLILCDSVHYSSPGSSVHGILQARILEWVAMPSSSDLPDPGIEPMSLMSPALAGRFFSTSATWEALTSCSTG